MVLYQLLDELIFCGGQRVLIDKSPVALVESKGLCLIDQIIIRAIPSDETELWVISDPNHGGQRVPRLASANKPQLFRTIGGKAIAMVPAKALV